MDNQFDIKIIRQHWAGDEGIDSQEDLCSHGEVYLRIGDIELSNAESGSWTLSSTALYLMRTIDENYEIGDYASQLIPCCGHLFMADESDDQFVVMPGCFRGIDWTIRHVGKNQILHIAPSGKEGIIDKEEYRKIVLKFANQVEKFYAESKPKKLPDDEYDRNGYNVFWNEWKYLKQKVESKTD